MCHCTSLMKLLKDYKMHLDELALSTRSSDENKSIIRSCYRILDKSGWDLTRLRNWVIEMMGSKELTKTEKIRIESVATKHKATVVLTALRFEYCDPRVLLSNLIKVAEGAVVS